MPTCATRRAWHSGVQALYEDNLVSMYRFVYKSLRNREAAENLTSLTFLKALHFLDP